MLGPSAPILTTKGTLDPTTTEYGREVDHLTDHYR